MSVDLRGFSYPLVPVLQRCQWQLDILLGKVAAKQKQLEDTKSELAQREAEYGVVVEAARQRQAKVVDPAATRNVLVFLEKLKAGIVARQKQINVMEDELSALRQEVLEAQRKLELTKAHREKMQQEYVVEEQNRQAAESDKDWLARHDWVLRGAQSV